MNQFVKDGQHFTDDVIDQLKKDFEGDKINTVYIAEGDCAAIEFAAKNPGKTALVLREPELKADGWNLDMRLAPSDEEILVLTKKSELAIYATFDSKWGKGRGAWFDRNNKLLCDVWKWRTDIGAYLESPQKTT